METMEHYPVVIIGSGVAGLSAAVYAARANNDPLVIKGDEPGGQLTLTSEVANYPGFDDGITGPELVNRTEKQAKKFGTTVKNGIVETVKKDGGTFHTVLENGEAYTSDAVIAASGASARTLGVEGEDKYMGMGLSTCATCDGAFFRGEDMLVVGGGDAALEEASFLTKFADTVYLAHRRDEWRGGGVLLDRVQEHVSDGSIELLMNTEVVEILGEESQLTGAKLVQHPDGYPKQKYENGEDVDVLEMDFGAVFYAIGHTPNAGFLNSTDVETDDDGYILTKQGRASMQTATDEDGVFAAGDVVDFHYQQAATASGMGVKAAMDVDEYLEST